MPVEPINDFSLAKFAAGAAGAFVSLRFVQGTPFERTTMGIGGLGLSYFGTAPLAQWMGSSEQAYGAIGFFLGLFGMSVIGKLFLVLDMMDAKQIAADIWEMIKRKWGA